MKQIEWRVRMCCAERGVWSATDLQRLVDRRTGVRLSPQTLQAWFRDRPVRIEVRTLTAILNTLGCPLTDVIRFDPPRTGEDARATPEEAAHYKQKGHAPVRKSRKAKRHSTAVRPRPDVGAMLAALAEGPESPTEDRRRGSVPLAHSRRATKMRKKNP